MNTCSLVSMQRCTHQAQAGTPQSAACNLKQRILGDVHGGACTPAAGHVAVTVGAGNTFKQLQTFVANGGVGRGWDRRLGRQSASESALSLSPSLRVSAGNLLQKIEDLLLTCIPGNL